ncbi:MAG: hypothetical protein QG597_110 [Actinomycetota bacterium]|nr:hypothetical protein [Actinomycetota bacterium]
MALRTAVDELVSELTSIGWGQPTRLFALVSSDLLLAEEPELASEIGAQPGTFTAIEQDGFDLTLTLPDMLSRIAWPEGVLGAAIAVEQLVLPPSAEADLSTTAPAQDLAAAAAADARATSLRIVAAVTRDGLEDTVFMVEGHDDPIRGGADERLAPRVIESLALTFRPAN